jgi:hypothetical protein
MPQNARVGLRKWDFVPKRKREYNVLPRLSSMFLYEVGSSWLCKILEYICGAAVMARSRHIQIWPDGANSLGLHRTPGVLI